MVLRRQGHESISRSSLEDAERRAITFMKGVNGSRRVRAQLVAAGYSAKVRADGLALYLKAAGFSTSLDVDVEDEQSGVAAALETIESWRRTGFARAHAALRHHHPEVDAFMFAGLEEASAVGAIATFLFRCEALEGAAERARTRAADAAALATLEERGITRAVRDDLRRQLDLVTEGEDVSSLEAEELDRTLERRHDLFALYLWVQDWTATARAVVTERADLIRLGIVRRRRAEDASATRDTEANLTSSSAA